MSGPLVSVVEDGPVQLILLCRPAVRNAIDRATAEALADAFRAFDRGPAAVAVLAGEGEHFCAGADLHAVARGAGNRVAPTGDGPLGPTRLRLQKPVIAAIEGYAVAGGLELALWCDLRVASETAVFGVFCRRFGVPLIDGGTVRLPRLIGQSRAMDLILTGRPVDAFEAHQMGLVNRVVEQGTARAAALQLAHSIASFPQACLQRDRASVLDQWSLPEDEALLQEVIRGSEVLETESRAGAQRFSAGVGRHGDFDD